MKRLTKTVQFHGERYYDLLARDWELTEWTQKQAQCVLDRIHNILDKLPAAVKQAHERIIGERKVESKEKLLSLYEDDIHVIVRGKSGSEVEFGNGLYLAEQENGVIVDWEFFKEQPRSDSRIVKSSIERIAQKFGKPYSFTADRGFCSKENSGFLKNENIFNGICPKSVPELRGRLQDDEFVMYQKRRAQTEGRIGIFKNVYLGVPFRCKGFQSREQLISLSVFTHNLWTFGRMARDAAYEKEKKAA